MIVGCIHNGVRILFGDVSPNNGNLSFADVDFHVEDLTHIEVECDALVPRLSERLPGAIE